MKEILIFILAVFISYHVAAQKEIRSDTLELPFTEDWSSGSFETNGWETFANWLINLNEGNDAPCAMFQGIPELTNYYKSIYSAYFNSSEIELGEVWLDFDLKLENTNSTNTEKLIVRVGDYQFSEAIYIRTNEENIDWEKIHLNISSVALKEPFMVNFVAYGQISSNIQYWMIDNIHIYRTCRSACNLTCEIDTISFDEYLLNASWQSCEPPQPPGNWIHWDSGINGNATGMDCDCAVTVAARWDAGQLAEYDGNQILKIKAYFFDIGYENLTFKIWLGENAETLLFMSDTLQPLERGWVETNLDTVMYIDSATEYWVGYSLYNLASFFPFGLDTGPAYEGYGDKISQDNGQTWENFSDYGFNSNWNIQFLSIDTSRRDLENIRLTNIGLNIYQSINGGDFQLYSHNQLTEGQTEYQFPMTVEPSENLYCYQFAYYYESNHDQCISSPFTTLEDPNIDYVCYLLTGSDNPQPANNYLITIFPNPANKQLNIDSEAEIQEVTLFNTVGQVVMSEKVQGKQAEMNISGLEGGVYFISIKMKEGAVTKKILINPKL